MYMSKTAMKEILRKVAGKKLSVKQALDMIVESELALQSKHIRRLFGVI